MKVRLTQLDGKLPNLALMKLAHWHRSQGDEVYLARGPTPNLFEPSYGKVYASAIFSWTQPVIERLRLAYPDAIVGGTGSGSPVEVEGIIGQEYEHYDYSIYPDFEYSIGFTQRGCRLKCGFCVVPKKEGKPRSVNAIRDIWREGTPRAVLLLDNDFFGQDAWRDRIDELKNGRFRVSFSQGINIRMITDESAKAIASVEYRDDNFERRRLYTAWDNLKDERVFFAGLDRLNAAGIPPKHVMVYMLIGYRPGETMKDVFYRFTKLRDAGCKPFPMVFEKWRQPQLRKFARWVIGRFHEFLSWEEFEHGDAESIGAIHFSIGDYEAACGQFDPRRAVAHLPRFLAMRPTLNRKKCVLCQIRIVMNSGHYHEQQHDLGIA